jgi:hypothetical protein
VLRLSVVPTTTQGRAPEVGGTGSDSRRESRSVGVRIAGTTKHAKVVVRAGCAVRSEVGSWGGSSPSREDC